MHLLALYYGVCLLVLRDSDQSMKFLTYFNTNKVVIVIESMSKRVTIMIDEDLDKKIRMRQAKLIQQEQSSYSYSRVLNETLRKSLK